MRIPAFDASSLPTPWRAALALLLCTASMAFAQTPPPAFDAALLAARQAALERANAATVGVEVTAVEDARSIGTLGRERQGSGVLIGADGLVLTIGYLILEAEDVDLVVDGGHRIPARVVAYDLASGFGLLQALTPIGIEPVPLGTSVAITEQDPLVIASGGEDGQLSLARMVSRRPFSGYWEYHIDGALFTTPARRDHSGAGLFSADGALLGIGSLVVSDAAGTDAPGLGGNMFVPIDLLKPILEELRARGATRSSTRAWLGLNCVEFGGQVRVVRSAPESPAEEAGLQPGDLILAIDGSAVSDLASFYKTLWRDERPERQVGLDVRRGARTIHVDVRAVDRMKTLSHPPGV